MCCARVQSFVFAWLCSAWKTSWVFFLKIGTILYFFLILYLALDYGAMWL